MPIDKATVALPGIEQPVDLYTLDQPDGIRARILTLGGAVMTLEVPDGEGRAVDVVLGFDEPAGYLDNAPFLGALIGRYGNRIARGQLPVGDRVFQLAKNDGANHLHGGPGGFHTVPWTVTAASDGAEPRLALRHVSRDGEEGYPGTVEVDGASDSGRGTCDASTTTASLIGARRSAIVSGADVSLPRTVTGSAMKPGACTSTRIAHGMASSQVQRTGTPEMSAKIRK